MCVVHILLGNCAVFTLIDTSAAQINHLKYISPKRIVYICAHSVSVAPYSTSFSFALKTFQFPYRFLLGDVSHSLSLAPFMDILAHSTSINLWNRVHSVEVKGIYLPPLPLGTVKRNTKAFSRCLHAAATCTASHHTAQSTQHTHTHHRTVQFT